jgi:hypothetical protein
MGTVARDAKPLLGSSAPPLSGASAARDGARTIHVFERSNGKARANSAQI